VAIKGTVLSTNELYSGSALCQVFTETYLLDMVLRREKVGCAANFVFSVYMVYILIRVHWRFFPSLLQGSAFLCRPLRLCRTRFQRKRKHSFLKSVPSTYCISGYSVGLSHIQIWVYQKEGTIPQSAADTIRVPCNMSGRSFFIAFVGHATVQPG